MENNLSTKKIFKFNMSIYYQSTIIYFVVFTIYVIVRGEFIEDSFKLLVKDPIIYFFVIVVLVSLAILLYNLKKNKTLEIDDSSFAFNSSGKIKKYNIDEIKKISISKKRERFNNRAFRLIRIYTKNRKRPIIIRPYDYENKNELIKTFYELKEKLNKN